MAHLPHGVDAVHGLDAPGPHGALQQGGSLGVGHPDDPVKVDADGQERAQHKRRGVGPPAVGGGTQELEACNGRGNMGVGVGVRFYMSNAGMEHSTVSGVPEQQAWAQAALHARHRARDRYVLSCVTQMASQSMP